MDYKPRYSKNFAYELKTLSKSNPKLKSIVKKALSLILKDPYLKSEYIKQLGCRRKHVAAKKYRIFYGVDKIQKKVGFYSIRLKNKQTYKIKIDLDW